MEKIAMGAFLNIEYFSLGWGTRASGDGASLRGIEGALGGKRKWGRLLIYNI